MNIIGGKTLGSVSKTQSIKVPTYQRVGLVMAVLLFALVASSPAATLVAQYEFEDNTLLTADVSGNGNNITSAFGNVVVTNDAIGGTQYALGAEPSSQSLLPGLSCPSSVAGIVAGDFSVSLWVNTVRVADAVSPSVVSLKSVVV